MWVMSYVHKVVDMYILYIKVNVYTRLPKCTNDPVTLSPQFPRLVGPVNARLTRGLSSQVGHSLDACRRQLARAAQ